MGSIWYGASAGFASQLLPPKEFTIYVQFRFLASAKLTGISSARSLTVSRESFEVTVSGGSTLARVKLKEIDGMAPQDVERAV